MKHVLVVDDYDAMRKLFWRFLNQEGCQVETAENASQALAAVKEKDFDVAFVDVELKDEINGLQVAEKLRELKPPIRIIIMSSIIEYKGDATSKGFDGFLLKPFLLEDVRSFVFQK